MAENVFHSIIQNCIIKTILVRKPSVILFSQREIKHMKLTCTTYKNKTVELKKMDGKLFMETNSKVGDLHDAV